MAGGFEERLRKKGMLVEGDESCTITIPGCVDQDHALRAVHGGVVSSPTSTGFGMVRR